ncbi:MAG: hypothetical protein WBN97_05290 [Parvibaculum sp.]
MSRDGFASLSASLLIRRAPPKATSDAPRPGDVPAHMRPAPEMRQSALLQGPDDKFFQREGRADPAPAGNTIYSGPERRLREVSPEIERRCSVPPRIKVSVRLEQHRYARLRMASQDMGRTHQDLMTKAIDHYLDMLRIPRIAAQKRDLNGLRRSFS